MQIKEEIAHECHKENCEGVVFSRTYQDNWRVEHCNTCNYWDAGFVRNN